jgi:outer membrane protein assembly factor BamB
MPVHSRPTLSRRISTLAALPLLLAACATPRIEPWSFSEGVNAPESAYLDPGSGYLFVSQIGLRPGGTPMDKNGGGVISKLTPAGKVIDARWVTGLNSPKGLRSYAGTLWVSAVDEVVAIDIATGAIKSRIPVAGAKFLNDVAIGADGTVYVSDMLTSKIHSIKDGKVSTFVEGEQVEYPNGLLVEGNNLVVAAWGKPEADFSTKVPGHLYRLNLATGAKTLITPNPTGNLDGLESDGRGGYIVSDWVAGKILHIAANGDTRLLKQMKQGTADIAYLPASRTLIVPHMLENRVQSYDLSAD